MHSASLSYEVRIVTIIFNPLKELLRQIIHHVVVKSKHTFMWEFPAMVSAI